MVGDVSVEEVVGPHDDGMICEKHPEREWPHSDPNESDGECAGPGMPLSNRLSSLVWQRDHERDRAEQAEAAVAQAREEAFKAGYHCTSSPFGGFIFDSGPFGAPNKAYKAWRALSGSPDETALEAAPEDTDAQ